MPFNYGNVSHPRLVIQKNCNSTESIRWKEPHYSYYTTNHLCLKTLFYSPQTGFEPVTNRLTADRSTTELLRIRRLIDLRFLDLYSNNTNYCEYIILQVPCLRLL